MVSKGTTLTPVDQFIFGAIKRTLSQSRAFRQMVEDWNFTSAAVMVRTQLDTAMRINGIRYMPDVEGSISRIFKGEIMEHDPMAQENRALESQEGGRSTGRRETQGAPA